MNRPRAGRLAALGLIAGTTIAACGGGEPPAPVDAPEGAAPGTPPALAEEKLGLDRQVLAAQADLARKLGVSPDAIEVVEAREVTWPDASRGCPAPGMMYAQALTPGVLVILRHGEATWRYHGARAGVPVHCPEGRAEPPADTGPAAR